ncbi:MAG: hypothetical protein K6A40_08725 [Solobacterium sp.]|nr:hypothetical protein [Solobacterium sp.]
MQLRFEQRLFSWFGRYDIYDENDGVLFTVEGRLAWGHELHIFDQIDREIGVVKEKIFRFLPEFEFYVNDEYQGYLKKRFALFVNDYDLDFMGWRVEGNFMGWDYEILDEIGRHRASVSKELFQLTDTYIIDVDNDEDALYALMIVLAIDAEKASSSS